MTFSAPHKRWLRYLTLAAAAEVQQSLQASEAHRFLLHGRHGAPLEPGGCFVGKASFSACRQQPVAAKVRAIAAFQTDCSHASHLLGSGGYNSSKTFVKQISQTIALGALAPSELSCFRGLKGGYSNILIPCARALPNGLPTALIAPCGLQAAVVKKHF